MKILRSEIKTLSKFPRYLREVVIINFFFFIISASIEGVWLYGSKAIDVVSGTLAPLLFISAILLFGFVGLYAFGDVSGWMKKEFEKATADSEEIEKALKEAKANLSSSVTIRSFATFTNSPQDKEEDKKIKENR